jgi:hypothetical protein
VVIELGFPLVDVISELGSIKIATPCVFTLSFVQVDIEFVQITTGCIIIRIERKATSLEGITYD